MKVTQNKKCHFDPITITLETRDEAETFFNIVNYSGKHPIEIYGHISQEELQTIKYKMYMIFKEMFDPSYIDCGDC